MRLWVLVQAEGRRWGMRTRADIDNAIHEEQALANIMHDAWASDSIDLLSGVESPADAIDREMEERRHLLRGGEDAPLVAPGVSVPVAVIGSLCLLAGAVLVVLAIVGGGA